MPSLPFDPRFFGSTLKSTFNSTLKSVLTGAVISALTLSLSVSCSPPSEPDPASADLSVQDDSSQSSHLEAIQQSGKLVMLAVPHQLNVFVRTNLDAGAMPDAGPAERFRGIDVEIMKRFAAELGVELEIRPARGADGIPAYTELIPQLLAGRGDVIASSFTITPARQQQVDFSPPYFIVRPVVVAPHTRRWTSPEDLQGATGSTIAASSQEEIFDELGIPRGNRLYVEFMLENYGAVEDGTADFTIVDSTSALTTLRQFSALKVQFEIPDREDPYGFAVPPDSDLLPLLANFVEQLKSSGELQQILDSGLVALD
ncbi:MAG: transporter substrate-binding domain-containing protein [Acidobacteriota bacterium]